MSPSGWQPSGHALRCDRPAPLAVGPEGTPTSGPLLADAPQRMAFDPTSLFVLLAMVAGFWLGMLFIDVGRSVTQPQAAPAPRQTRPPAAVPLPPRAPVPVPPPRAEPLPVDGRAPAP